MKTSSVTLLTKHVLTERVMDGLESVHALAASPGFSQDGVCCAAGTGGLYLSCDGGRSWQDACASLALASPLVTTAVVFSPDFAHDRTLFASVPGGVLRSHDAGTTWHVAPLSSPPPFVTALAVSPNYAKDGLIFAATLEDGILRSCDRGATWAAWNFGLLDFHVYALALSPNFAHDDTLYVGCESGIFRSSSSGRGWQETAFPMDCAPVLSLALSPDFTTDGVIFAGTEASGLWISSDRGVTWRAVSGWETPGPINALILPPTFAQQPWILAVTDTALCLSRDGGMSWQVQHSIKLTGITCAAALSIDQPNIQVILGTSDGGVLLCKL
uniref:Photosynthesis system II assembly factor Ycf48/Hcf136-like domain-containing protein n=1 Tax=Caldilinea aerophila TaxID=133453 RepID=A0A7C1FUD8_9CHLR